jgi:phage protein D
VATDLSDLALTVARKAGADITLNTVREAARVDAIAAPPPRGTILQLGLGGDLTPMMTSNTAKELRRENPQPG